VRVCDTSACANSVERARSWAARGCLPASFRVLLAALRLPARGPWWEVGGRTTGFQASELGACAATLFSSRSRFIFSLAEEECKAQTKPVRVVRRHATAPAVARTLPHPSAPPFGRAASLAWPSLLAGWWECGRPPALVCAAVMPCRAGRVHPPRVSERGWPRGGRGARTVRLRVRVWPPPGALAPGLGARRAVAGGARRVPSQRPSLRGHAAWRFQQCRRQSTTLTARGARTAQALPRL
jgi:hypothetical protein